MWLPIPDSRVRAAEAGSSADTTPPALLYAGGTPTFTELKVGFSEPLDAGAAENLANYSVSDGVTVLSAKLISIPQGRSVLLKTSRLPEDARLTLTVRNIKDIAGNTMATETKEFGTHRWLPGVVLHEYWTGVSGEVSALRALDRFPNSPAFYTLEPMFEFPPDGAGEYADSYGNRLSAWFVPPETADYVFFIASDEVSNLYLSTDDDPAHIKLIARENGASRPRDWTIVDYGDVKTKRSDTFIRSEWPPAPGSPIHLEAGKKYYLELLHVETSGWRDNMAATYTFAGEGEPERTPRLIEDVVGLYVDPNFELAFTSMPQHQTAPLPTPTLNMLTLDFKTGSGDFAVTNSRSAPAGPWVHDAEVGRWAAPGPGAGCDGPFASRLRSPKYKVAQDSFLSLTFTHRYSFQYRWDGGQVRLSVNGANYRTVPSESFASNGYAAMRLAPGFPLRIPSQIAVQNAFTGDSKDYVSDEMITSRAILGAFSKDDEISLEFLAAWDDCWMEFVPSWEITGLALDSVPMSINNFTKGDSGFTVQNTPMPAPAAWTYSPAARAWVATRNDVPCADPFASTLISPLYVASQSGPVTLNFEHSYSFANDSRDGGQVRVSVNGSPFTPIAAQQFVRNGYAVAHLAGNGLLHDQPGFSGNSAGYVISSARLGKLNQGDRLVIQFVGAWDGCAELADASWQIRNVQLAFGALPEAVTFTAAAVASLYGEAHSVNYQWQEGIDGNYTDIPGATSASYRFYPTAADFQKSFRLQAATPSKSVYSEPARLLSDTATPAAIGIMTSAGGVSISFTGKLQQASSPAGPYVDVPGATSPYAVSTQKGAAFYRAAGLP